MEGAEAQRETQGRGVDLVSHSAWSNCSKRIKEHFVNLNISTALLATVDLFVVYHLFFPFSR